MLLKNGDYIKYDTGITTVGENGIVMFRVLYPMDSEYGLQIISNENLGEDITLGGSTWEEGKESYNETIKKLNKEAEKYVNNRYAYDGRCVGSIPTIEKGMFVDKNKFKDREGNVPSTILIPDSFTIPDTWNGNRDTGCDGEDAHHLVDEMALGSTMLNTGQKYWLASRYVWLDSSNTSFNVRAVEVNGNQIGTPLCYVASHGWTGVAFYTCGLRPCISLKSNDIKIISGDGQSEETAYTVEK